MRKASTGLAGEGDSIRRPLPQTPSLATLKKSINGKCANRKLSQWRGSPHETVPNFVPSARLYQVVAPVPKCACERVNTNESQIMGWDGVATGGNGTGKLGRGQSEPVAMPPGATLCRSVAGVLRERQSSTCSMHTRSHNSPQATNAHHPVRLRSLHDCVR